MSSPYNTGRYNLLGYNVTPTVTNYAAALITERIGFVAVSTVNNVYPKARLYENVNKLKAQLVPGKFSVSISSDEIDCTQAALIGCSWREVTSNDVIYADLVGERQFWRKVTSNDSLGIRNAEIIGAYWKEAETENEIDSAKAEMIGMSWRQATSSDVITAEIKPSQVVYIGTQLDNAISERAHLSEEVFQSATAFSTFNSRWGHLSSKTYAASDVLDLIDAHCDVQSFEILTCVITATLPPGQTMVIDAGTYDVWINGQNAVYTHSGDWFDELNRNTQNFTINAASGRAYLSATILYTERYL